ncbi:MAG: FAD-dependent oxidoreductase [bacterium]|nr:FAD-dependent oxidoreductase [bacterium]
MNYDLVIIGAASAGLTAGIYAGRKKINTVILSKEVGGQALLTDTIENFPGFDSISGKELAAKERAQAEKFGAEIKEGVEVESIEKDGDDFLIKIKGGDSIGAKSVIIATGKNPRRLGVPGEREFENKGVSFCSICDAPLYGGKDVAVVGGGNSGLESAMDLTKYANKIYVLEFSDKIIGDESMQEKLAQTGKVEFIADAEVLEIKGDVLVEKIIYKDKKTGETKELPVGGVFVNIGWVPATGFLSSEKGDFVELNDGGEVVIDHKTTETSVKGVYAAGDVSDVKYKQCVIAAAEGAKAALSAHEYLTRK